MAHKLKCPKCSKVLKQQGDLGKKAQGEYIVLPDYQIQCLECRWIDKVRHFDEELLK